MPALAELSARRWDEGYPEFPASSFQVSNIHAGTGANNVIPGHCEVLFNFRYNPGWSAEALEREVHAVLDRHGLEYDLRWHRGGEPFLTGEGRLRAAVRAVLMEQCGTTPDENTGGGTSDARFIAPLGAEVVEVGPVNATIHKVDERVAVAELERLPALYRAIAERLLSR
jgi:succinyl-diaminopimelate desuccinylase